MAASSSANQRSIYAATFPDRVYALGLWHVRARAAWAPDYPWAWWNPMATWRAMARDLGMPDTL
jgi:hypothetical protein